MVKTPIKYKMLHLSQGGNTLCFTLGECFEGRLRCFRWPFTGGGSFEGEPSEGDKFEALLYYYVQYITLQYNFN